MNANTSFGSLSVGVIPRVVGTVSDKSTLTRLAKSIQSVPCDVVELRLDEVGTGDSEVFPLARQIEEQGLPVFMTLRLRSEGGQYADDAGRLGIFAEALNYVSGVDVELNSSIAKEVAKLARNSNKVCITSYHDFQKTPPLPQLQKVVLEAQKFATIAKIATMISEPGDIQVLSQLLSAPGEIPLCLIGMGDIGSLTRLIFPLQGSCLTYGFLQNSNAPGQLSAAKLVEHLRLFSVPYNQDFTTRRKVLEPA